MNTIDIIKHNFNKGYFNKGMLITSMPDEYPAWTIKNDDWYGVAVPIATGYSFSERFSRARIWTSNAEIEGQSFCLLILSCEGNELRNEFALVCAQFVEPGKDGCERRALIEHPELWWNRWKILLGNRDINSDVYPIIGELITVEKLLERGLSPRWSGIESATHDVELPNISYEVKSTTARYGYEVEISSIFQLNSEKPLTLVFYRFEKSLTGISLNDVVSRLSELGYPEDKIEASLCRKGLEKGCTARDVHFKMLEMKAFSVDNDFPKLTLDSFSGGALPAHIKKVKYTLDLTGLEGSNDI